MRKQKVAFPGDTGHSTLTGVKHLGHTKEFFVVILPVNTVFCWRRPASKYKTEKIATKVSTETNYHDRD